MMTLVSMTMFGGALGLALYVMAATVAPQWRRIVDILFSPSAPLRVAPVPAPVSARERAERRSAVRRWSAESAPGLAMRSREAA